MTNKVASDIINISDAEIVLTLQIDVAVMLSLESDVISTSLFK